MDSKYQKDILDNGIRVVTENIPYVRSISLGVWISVGSRDESSDEEGISHFLEHMLFKGTTTRNAHQIASALESVGGVLDAFTSREYTCYYVRILDEHVPRAIDVLSDILINSVFDPQRLEKEKQVVIEEIKNLEDSPDELIHDLFAKTLWGAHPLGNSILGTIENVSAFSSDKIRSFLQDQYITSRIVVAAAGNINHQQIVELVNSSFHFSTKGKNRLNARLPSITPKIDHFNRDYAQMHICIGTVGIPYLHSDRYVLLLLNSALGDGMSSRLFQSIREQAGLAYSVYSFLDFFQDTGLFGTYLGVDPARTSDAMDLLLKELISFRKKGMTEEELANTKEQLKGNLMLGLESTNNRMIRLARTELYQERYLSLDETLHAIDKVTIDDVTRVADEIIDPSKFSMTLIGPLDRMYTLQDLQKFR